MVKRFYLRFILNDLTEDVVFEVREKESDRLQSILGGLNKPISNEDNFFWFDSIDGISVILNLRYLQVVRYLWDASESIPDVLHYEGRIKVFLRGRKNPLELTTEDYDILYDFFANLEHGTDRVPCPYFIDIDGEIIQFNPSEIIFVESPSYVLLEGKQKVESEQK